MSNERPICGRCGYDLSGVVESWGDGESATQNASCPVEGVCSECGWAFAWGDVFNAWRLDCPWLVEHARTRPQVLRRIPSTLWRAALPWRFWGGLSMQARVRPWVAVLALLVWLLPLHLAVNGHETYRVIEDEYQYVKKYGSSQGFAPAPFDRTSLGPLVASVAGAPVVRPRVNAARVALPPGPGVPLAIKRWLAPPGTPSTLSPMVTRETVPWWGVGAIAMIVSWVGLLALLPATRALTKLRWVHVARSAVYSGAVAVLLIEAARVLTYHEPSGTYELAWPVFVVIAAWQTVWWVSAVTLGWRMKHGVAVAMLLAIAAVLAGLTAGVVFDPYLFTGVL